MKFTINLWVKIALRQILNEKNKIKFKHILYLILHVCEIYYKFE